MENQIMRASDDLYRQVWEQAYMSKREALARAYNAEQEAKAAWKAYDRLKKRVAFIGTALLAVLNIVLYVLVLA